jgi:CheY-like chemotaxis protein
LVLVKQIVELHGGYVDVNSQLGSGSCFSIHLPCSAGSQLVATSVTINHSSTNSQTDEIITHQAQSEQFPLVLLAEDNEANISTVSSYLKAKGYRILLAKHGQEAITMARQHHPDLILMDIQMPGMDGLEATKQIRQDSELADTPIVALTALAMPGDRERCLAAGANDYISKPVKLKQLVTVMQQLLMNRG